MYIAAGPEWALLYNDAYAPMLGARHPQALAAPFETTWPEVWPGLQPALADALAGKAVFHEDLPMLLARRGWPEETWFTFSLSAVGAAESGADGVFCACTETTGRVIGERRLRALGELAGLGSVTDAEAAAVAAVDVLARYRADVPAALLYLSDDQRGRARLVAAEGVVPGGPLAPASVGRRRLLGPRPARGDWRPAAARSSPAWPAHCPTGGSAAPARCVRGCSAATGTTRRRSTPPSSCPSAPAPTGPPACSSPG